jgi:hypothetical protein
VLLHLFALPYQHIPQIFEIILVALQGKAAHPQFCKIRVEDYANPATIANPLATPDETPTTHVAVSELQGALLYALIPSHTNPLLAKVNNRHYTPSWQHSV